MRYADVTSTFALVLALGAGSAVAATQLDLRSVGERQLRPGAVTASKIRTNAITAPKIKALAVKNGKLAGGAVDTTKLSNGAVTSEKVANAAIGTAKLGLESVTGEKVNENTLGPVPNAARSEVASFAESANPAAFAKIGKTGTIEPSSSRGIAAVKAIETGVYCITAASFSPSGAQVTPQFDGVGTVAAFVRIGGAASCPAPQIEVQTWNGGLKVDAPFFVVAYR